MGELQLETDYHQVIFLEAHIEGTWWQMLYFWLKMLNFWKNCFIFRKKLILPATERFAFSFSTNGVIEKI